jgi:hypothetical protein
MTRCVRSGLCCAQAAPSPAMCTALALACGTTGVLLAKRGKSSPQGTASAMKYLGGGTTGRRMGEPNVACHGRLEVGRQERSGWPNTTSPDDWHRRDRRKPQDAAPMCYLATAITALMTNAATARTASHWPRTHWSLRSRSWYTRLVSATITSTPNCLIAQSTSGNLLIELANRQRPTGFRVEYFRGRATIQRLTLDSEGPGNVVTPIQVANSVSA